MCTYRCMYVFTQYTHAHMLVHTCAQLYYKLWLGSSHRINAFLSLFTCIELCHHGLVVDACELAHFSCMWLGTCLLAFVSSTSMFQVSLRGLNSSTVMRLLTILTPFFSLWTYWYVCHSISDFSAVLFPKYSNYMIALSKILLSFILWIFY